MKIAVLNNSGNVGKTTVCQNVLLPRLKDYTLIRVETLNNDGDSTGEKLSAEKFDSIFELILTNENVIIDIGSSNIEIFSKKLKDEYAGSHSFIDYFLIPVTPDEKQQKDTIATILFLLDLGVEREKIKIIFNKTNSKISLDDQFNVLINNEILKALDFKINNITSIKNTTLFDSLLKANLSYSQVSKKTIEEIEKQIKSLTDKQQIIKLNLLKFYRMGFDSYQNNISEVFNEMNLI